MTTTTSSQPDDLQSVIEQGLKTSILHGERVRHEDFEIYRPRLQELGILQQQVLQQQPRNLYMGVSYRPYV